MDADDLYRIQQRLGFCGGSRARSATQNESSRQSRQFLNSASSSDWVSWWTQSYEQVIADLQKRLAALERKAAEQETKAPSAEKYSVTAQEAAQELAKPVVSGVPPYPHG